MNDNHQKHLDMHNFIIMEHKSLKQQIEDFSKWIGYLNSHFRYKDNSLTYMKDRYSYLKHTGDEKEIIILKYDC